MYSYKPNFNKGDIITYCDEEFVVLEDLGYNGRIQENCKNGAIINVSWNFQDEKCLLKADGVDRRNE
jgi:hypothetical protein